MSSGSYFVILKNSQTKLNQQQLHAANLTRVGDDIIMHGQKDNIQQYTKQCIERLSDMQVLTYSDQFSIAKFYDKNDGTIWDKILSIEFNSELTAIKQYFYMNPYHNTADRQISYNQCCKMIQACQYILNGTMYNQAFELILDNCWINTIGEQVGGFENRFTSKLVLSELQKNLLTRIRNGLITFKTIIDQNDTQHSLYKLVYKVW